MPTLSNIKKDVEFNTGLSALIEVLKNIAVSQFKALERKVKSYDKLLNALDSFFELIDPAKVGHPFLVPRNKTQIVVAITSDSGLLGGLNMQVINAALNELERMPGRLVVIGDRGKAYARETKMPFVSFGGIKEEEYFSQAKQLRDYLTDGFKEESMGYLKVIFPRPVTFTVQRVEAVSFLPFHQEAANQAESAQPPRDMILESTPAQIIEYLVSIWMEQKLAEIFLLSRLAEYASRFLHLEGSSQRLKEMDKKLRLQYFRVRHEIIDRNMRELFSARLLYAGKN